ncbi:MAG: ribosome biogenesis GTP-binding protein YihA/YsxC [Bacteroidota bacterium]
MIIKTVEFAGSFPSVKKCPDKALPEYAFIGRSNVGKSSLINMLCERKDLAKVSKQPGKTQMINYFTVNERWNLVDLPGYGFAKVSKKHRASFGKMIEGYLDRRKWLQCTFVLIDINVPPQRIDMDFLNWMGHMGIPFVLVFTKTDKLKKKGIDEALFKFRNEMLKVWAELPEEFVSSAVNKNGREEIFEFITDINEQFFEDLKANHYK